MEPFRPASRMAGDCRPTRAAVEVSGTGRSDWRRRETIQGRPENAGSETAQAGIGNAKQSLLYLWAFLGLRGNFNRNSGKIGLFAPAFAPSRRPARDGDWEGAEETGASHVARLVSEACFCATAFGSAFLLLDRLYPSVEALLILNACNAVHSGRVDMISRMKRNAIAWTEAPDRRPGQS